MSFDAHANFAYSLISTAPIPASSGASFTVSSGDGAKFPAAPFNAVVWPAGQQPSLANAEIVRVTAQVVDTFTCSRNQELQAGSQTRTVVVGDQFAAVCTAKALTDIETSIVNAVNNGGVDFVAHGVVVASAAAVQKTIALGVDGSMLIGATGADPIFATRGMQFRDPVLRTVVSTTAETTVYTYPVPAGLLGTNLVLETAMFGDVFNNSGSVCNMTVRAKYGATTFFQQAFTSVNAGANRGGLILQCGIAACNAANVQVGWGRMFMDATNEGGAVGGAPQKDFVGGGSAAVTATGSGFGFNTHVTMAEDSTLAKDLTISFQVSVSNANIDMRSRYAYTEAK